MALMSLIDKQTARQHASGESKPAKGAAPAEDGGMEGVKTYLKGVRAEWDKVTWPSKVQMWQQTIVVLITVLVFAVGIYSIDWVFRGLIGLITPQHTY
ncbi:MAG: preprotein translocase subunit SecE [Candidatus Melainabacteria bacterium]